MQDGPLIASVAALIGDPARANMLTALMDGRALTASELAEAAGVALPTASGHLARLAGAGMVTAEKQGRHRYFRLSGPDVAGVLESLMGLAQRTGAVRLRTGPRDTALRAARLCYDHMAGQQAVALLSGLYAAGWLDAGTPPVLTAKGRDGVARLGIDAAALERSRRPVCLGCLDWSERRHHLGGGLGAAILGRASALGWIRRGDGRVLHITDAGQEGLRSWLAQPETQGAAPAPS